MRKILYLLAIIAVAGCQKNEPDLLMGKNASERMAQNKENLKKTLSEAPNGWRLSYFPKRNTFGGYTFLMKFTPEGRVTMVADFGSGTAPKESSYQIQEGQGPLLVFTTRNYIHTLLEPLTDSPDPREHIGKGLEGEFQFVYIGQEGDKLKFKTQRKATEQFVYFEKATAEDWRTIGTQGEQLDGINHTYYLKVTSAQGVENYFVRSAFRMFLFTSMQDSHKASRAGIAVNPNGLTFTPSLEIAGEKFTHMTAVPGTPPLNYTAQSNGVTIELRHFNNPMDEFESQADGDILNYYIILLGDEAHLRSPYMSDDFISDFYTEVGEGKFFSYELLFQSNADTPLLRIGYTPTGNQNDRVFYAYKCNYEIRDKKIYITYIGEYGGEENFWRETDNEEILRMARQRLTHFIALSSQGIYLWKSSLSASLGPVYYMRSISEPNYYFPGTKNQDVEE